MEEFGQEASFCRLTDWLSPPAQGTRKMAYYQGFLEHRLLSPGARLLQDQEYLSSQNFKNIIGGVA